MEIEINSLDEKVRQLAQLCQKLRTDNSELRQQLVSAKHENQRLNEKITTATGRLESMLEKIPDDVQ
jgi:cell division protein ZapB